MVNRVRLEEQLVLHEGLRLVPYKDSEGLWTIGVGYNISHRGWVFFEHVTGRTFQGMTGIRVTKDESLLVLRADIDRIEPLVIAHFPEYNALNEVRQRVCMDMAFNMGYRALGFNNTIAALKHAQWSIAARELHKSKWAGQVGNRASRLAKMILTGQDYVL